MVTPQVPALLDTQQYWRTRELREHGMSDKAIQRLVGAKSLIRVHRGCYTAPPGQDTGWEPAPGDLLKAYRHASLPTPEAGQLYSHTSAARLWGLHLWNVDETVHLCRPGAPAGQRNSRIKIHQAVIPRDQSASIWGFPVTTLERTVVDCARMLGYRQGLILADHGLRTGADRRELNRIAAVLRGHKGIGRARMVLEAASGLAESPGETLTRHFFASMNLPIPVEQYVVDTRLGQHRLDFALPELMLAIEFDGKTKYFDYRPTSETVFQERRREKALGELGWQFLRIEWADLFRQAELKERVLTAIAAAERRRREHPRHKPER